VGLVSMSADTVSYKASVGLGARIGRGTLGRSSSCVWAGATHRKKLRVKLQIDCSVLVEEGFGVAALSPGTAFAAVGVVAVTAAVLRRSLLRAAATVTVPVSQGVMHRDLVRRAVQSCNVEVQGCAHLGAAR
jgi:hypothetical protein